MARVAPDFIVLGAMKAGTTTLFDYLSRHPQVVPPSRKEIHYFSRHFRRGEGWYLSHFPRRWRLWGRAIWRRARAITGEGTPFYLYHPLAARRIAGLVPGARLIAILRNPVDRAYSHYQHELEKGGREDLTFEEALECEEQRLAPDLERLRHDEAHDPVALRHFSYRSRGLYAAQISEYLRWFARDQLLVLSSERFRSDADDCCDRICDFLGVARWHGVSRQPLNPGVYQPMRAETRRRLAEFYAPHNRELEALLGMSFGWDAAT